MSIIDDLHNRAMELSDAYLDALQHDTPVTDTVLLNLARAYELERQAAELCVTEPSRSILYLSAGCLAGNLGLWSDALTLANEGLKTAIYNDTIGKLLDLLIIVHGNGGEEVNQ